jgi:adenylate cyclase
MNPPSSNPPVEVRFYERDGSVFLDTHYLIKGVAGAIFWKLACENSQRQRSEFSLRELRLAGAELRLPDVQDNLSTRMLLLQRRLAERRAVMQIHKSGRGRFRIELQRSLQLTPVPDPARMRAPSHG